MYGKIFERVFTGSMYGSGPVVFAVWAYVIAHAEPPGVVELNPKYLAGCIGTSREEIQRAIEFLCQPDDDSQNKEEEGRRLVATEGMLYRVISFQKYRELRHASDRREYHRDYWHKRKNQQSLNQPQSTQQNSTDSTKAEVEAEVDTTTSTTQSAADDVRFEQFWSAYPRKEAKATARKAFRGLKVSDTLLRVMLAALTKKKATEQWLRERGKYIPHAATWLNGRRWGDDDESEPPGDGPSPLPQINPSTGQPNWV